MQTLVDAVIPCDRAENLKILMKSHSFSLLDSNSKNMIEIGKRNKCSTYSLAYKSITWKFDASVLSWRLRHAIKIGPFIWWHFTLCPLCQSIVNSEQYELSTCIEFASFSLQWACNMSKIRCRWIHQCTRSQIHSADRLQRIVWEYLRIPIVKRPQNELKALVGIFHSTFAKATHSQDLNEALSLPL